MNIKTLIGIILIIGLIIFMYSFGFLVGKYVTDAKSVSELNPQFSYQDATDVAESIY